MKKFKTALMVRRETIRTLGHHDLTSALGGAQGNCTAVTQLASGCTSTAWKHPKLAL